MLKWLKKKFDPNVAHQPSPQVIDDEDEVGCEVEEETFLDGSLKEESKSGNESKGERKLIWGGLGVCEVRDEHMFEAVLYKVTNGAKSDGGARITLGTGEEGRNGDKFQNDVEKSVIQEKQTDESRNSQDQAVSQDEEKEICIKKDIELVHTTVPVLECMNRKDKYVGSDEISSQSQKGVEENLGAIASTHEDLVKEHLCGSVSKDEEIDQDTPRSSKNNEVLSVTSPREETLTLESSQSCTFMLEKVIEGNMERINAVHETDQNYQRDSMSKHRETPGEIMTDASKCVRSVEESECCTYDQGERAQEYLNDTLNDGVIKEEIPKGITSENEKNYEGILRETSRNIGSNKEGPCCSTSKQENLAQENDILIDGNTKEKRLGGIITERGQIDKEALQTSISEYENIFSDAIKDIATKSDQGSGNLVSGHKNIMEEEYKCPVSIHCTEETLKASASVMEKDQECVINDNPEETESKKEILESSEIEFRGEQILESSEIGFRGEQILESSEIEFRGEQEEKDKSEIKSESLEIGIDSPEVNVESDYTSLSESKQHFIGTSHDPSCRNEVIGKTKEYTESSVEMERCIKRTKESILKEGNAFESKCEVTQKADGVCAQESLADEEKCKHEEAQDRQLNGCKILQNIECEGIKELEEVCTENPAIVEEERSFEVTEDDKLKECSGFENNEYEDMIEKVNGWLEKSLIHKERENFEGIDDVQYKECNTLGNIKCEVAVDGPSDFETNADLCPSNVEACEKGYENFVTFPKVLLDLRNIVVLYPSHFRTNKIDVTTSDQVNNVHEPCIGNSYVGLVNGLEVPHLHSPSFKQSILRTYQMGPTWQSIPDSLQGATSPRPLGTTLFNQMGIICSVLQRKCILTKIFGQLVIIDIRTAFMHLVPEIEYHGLEKPLSEKPKGKREVIRISDVTEETVVMFDAVVDTSQNYTGGFEAVAVWQGHKPTLTVSPLDHSYIVLKSQEGCQAEIRAVSTSYIKIAVEVEGGNMELRVRSEAVFYKGNPVTKAALRKLKKQGILFKANVYLLCKADHTQQFLCTCVWDEGKPPEGVSLDFNLCYTLENDLQEKPGGHHRKLIMDYPAQINRGSRDEALLSFVDEFGIFVRIPLSEEFLEIFSVEKHRKQIPVWIHFQRTFSTKKIQEVIAIQTVPDKMLILPITLKCPLPGHQLKNETVLKEKKDILFEADDEERLELGNDSSKMLDMFGNAAKGTAGLVETDFSGERQEEMLGKICDTTHLQLQKALASAAVSFPVAPTWPISEATPSSVTEASLHQETFIPEAHSLGSSTQANDAVSKVLHDISTQPVVHPSVRSMSSLSEAEKPVVTDAPPPLASSSPVIDRLAHSDQISTSFVKRCLPGQNRPLGLHTTGLNNQKAVLRYDKRTFILKSDSEIECFLIKLTGQEHVVVHGNLVDVTAVENGATVYFDALWTGHEYEPILLWQGPKPCFVAHHREFLFFDVSALIITCSESYLVLQVQNGQRSEEFKVKLEKEIFTRGEMLQSCIDSGTLVLVHLKKKAIDDKFEWFLMLLTIDNCMDRKCMDPAFLTFMLAEDCDLASSLVKKDNLRTQSMITSATNKIQLTENSQKNHNVHAEMNSISQTSEVNCNVLSDLQSDVTTAESLGIEKVVSKVTKYEALFDNSDVDISRINEEWSNVVKEVSSCSSGTIFHFNGKEYMKMHSTEWKAGNFKKCFANGWYLIECLQDKVTVLMNRDQIYTESHLCFQERNPENEHTLVLLYETVAAKEVQNLNFNGYTVAAWLDKKIADIPFHSCPYHKPTQVSVWPYEQEPECLIRDIIMVKMKGIVKPPSTYIFGCTGHMLSIQNSSSECGTFSVELANGKLPCTFRSPSLLNGEQFDDLVGKECYSIIKTSTTGKKKNSFERNYEALMVWKIKSSSSFMKSEKGSDCCSSAIRFCIDQIIDRFKYITAHGSVIGFQKALPTSPITPETLLLIAWSLPGSGNKVKVFCSASRVIGIAMQDMEKLRDCCFLLPRELFLLIIKERQTACDKTNHEICDLARKRQKHSAYEGEYTSVKTKHEDNESMANMEEISVDRESVVQVPNSELVKDNEETCMKEDVGKFASDDEDMYKTEKERRFNDVRYLSDINLSRIERNDCVKELNDVEKEIQSSEGEYSECRWKTKRIGNNSVNVYVHENEIIFEDSIVALWPKGLSPVYTKLCHVHGVIPPQSGERSAGEKIVVDITDRPTKEVLSKNVNDAMEEQVEMFEQNSSDIDAMSVEWESSVGDAMSGKWDSSVGDAMSVKLEYEHRPSIGRRKNLQNTEDITDISGTNDEDYCCSTDFDSRSNMNKSRYSNEEGTSPSHEKDQSDLENYILRAGFGKKDISLSRMLEKQLLTENGSSDQFTGSVASCSNASDISSEVAKQGSDILQNMKRQAKKQSKCQNSSTKEGTGHSQESEIIYRTCGLVQSDSGQAIVSFNKDGVKNFVHVSKKVFLSDDKKLTKKSSLEKVINVGKPVGVYFVQDENRVLWEHRITYKAIVAFVGKKPSKCDAMIEDYSSKKNLLSSKELESKTVNAENNTNEGSIKDSVKLKRQGIDQKSLKKLQKNGAIVLKPQSSSTVHVTGKVHSNSFTYGFIETKKKNVILFWHSCTDPEAKHLCDFLAKSGGTVKTEVIPLIEEFQVEGICVTHVAVLAWCDKTPKQKPALIQEHLKTFPWIITNWNPLYICPQFMCKPSQVKELKSGRVTYHSNKIAVLQCCDENKDTIYVSFKEEAIHPFFAETYCEYTKSIRHPLNKVVNLFGKDWYCISEDTEPHQCNGIHVTHKALQVWPSLLQVREPVEVLSADPQTFCIASCRILHANDDFGVARLKGKGLALFFKRACDPSCHSVLKEKSDLQIGVVKLATPVKVENNVVSWLALKIWEGKVTEKLIQQMGLSLDALPWSILNWKPLLLTHSLKPSLISPGITQPKEHLPHESVSTNPKVPVETKANLNPAELSEVESNKDSMFHTCGTITKIMKASAFLECKKKGLGTILVHCKKSDFSVNKEAPDTNNFEKWLEPYVSLRFNCIAKKVKPVTVGSTEISYVSTKVWAKTSRGSVSAPALNITSQSSSTVSLHTESKKVVRKKKLASADSKKDDTSVWKQEFKHMLKGKVKEVHSTVCQILGEDGKEKYYVSSSQCFLYGICLSCVELWHVFHTGLCVYYELQDNQNGMIKHVWIGEMVSKSPGETHRQLEKWCAKNTVSVYTKDILLLQIGYVNPMLAPIAADSEEEVETALGYLKYCESSNSDSSW